MKKLQKFGAAMRSDFDRVGSLAKSASGKTMIVLGSAAASTGAFAADFDGSEIATKIGVYVAAGVVILTAFVVGKWTLRAFGVIK